MKAFDDPEELVDAIDEAKTFLVPRVLFWPKRWQAFAPPKDVAWRWRSVPFAQSSSPRVPANEHGLYTFVLCPSVADHPKNHLVLYVGKAEKMTLRGRFKSYFAEMRKVKRSHICYALNKYSGHLEFCFVPVSNRTEIGNGEDALLCALLPPYNDEFPAEVREIIKGLR